MRTFLRRLRGALVLAALWSAVWLPAGIVLDLLLGLTGSALRPPVFYLGLFTAFGAASGAFFAVLLALLERHRSFAELSARRLQIWGAAAGAVLPIAASLVALAILPGARLTANAFLVFAALALLGAGCAWATLAIARRGTAFEPLAPPA